MLGLGVMIHTLCGDENTMNAIKISLGKVIKEVKIDDDVLKFEFEDATKLNFRDGEHTCCGSRYMSTDDNLKEFEGSLLQDFELKDGGSADGEYDGEHDIAFLEVTTNKGSFQISNHNEHNGYYGGFSIEAELSS